MKLHIVYFLVPVSAAERSLALKEIVQPAGLKSCSRQMGGLLSLRLLAGLLYELTTAEIRLQLIHVVCFTQIVRNRQFCL